MKFDHSEKLKILREIMRHYNYIEGIVDG